MDKITPFGATIFRVVAAIMLLVIIIYQIRLDSKLDKIEKAARQAASFTVYAESNIEDIKNDTAEIKDRLDI